MVEKTFCIGVKQGLNVDMARKMANLAEKYDCTALLCYGEGFANMGSLLNIVAMGVVCGDEVTVQCIGEQEALALEAYEALLS